MCNSRGFPDAVYSAEIVDTVGEVRIFLNFANDNACTEGMLRAGGHEECISRAHRLAGNQRFHGAALNTG